jgi:hypothetical protein
MKLKYTIFVVLTCILLAGLEVKTVAAETQLSPAEAKAKLESSAVEIATLRSNIFLTLTELDQMRNPQNRQAAFQRFSAQLTNVVDQVHATAERVRTMRQRGDAYFAEWEARTAGIQDAEQRHAAESRYKVRKQSYDRLLKNLQEARSNFEPMLKDLNEIKALLEENPNAAKVAAAKELFMRANWSCIDTQRCLMTAEAEFAFLAADFAQNEK